MGCSNGGSADKVKDGGGFSYVHNGRTYIYQQRNGNMYDVTDLSDIDSRQKLNTNQTANDVVKRLKGQGSEVTIISPKDMVKREQEYKARREAFKNVDLELGVGVPWGNKQNRQAARRARLTTRGMKRPRGG